MHQSLCLCEALLLYYIYCMIYIKQLLPYYGGLSTKGIWDKFYLTAVNIHVNMHSGGMLPCDNNKHPVQYIYIYIYLYMCVYYVNVFVHWTSLSNATQCHIQLPSPIPIVEIYLYIQHAFAKSHNDIQSPSPIWIAWMYLDIEPL